MRAEASGSELARQVWSISPRRLVLVDRAESSLYLIERELDGLRATKSGNPELRVHLGNVASRSAIDRLLAIERPDVVFHAAAYKHVPMLETSRLTRCRSTSEERWPYLDSRCIRGCRAVRACLDRQGSPSDERDGSKQADRGNARRATRHGAIGRPLRLGPVRKRAGLRPAAWSRSSRTSSRRAEPLTITASRR